MRDGVVQRADELTVITHGEVAEGAREYARRRVGAVVDHIAEPVLFARVKLAQAADPARERPASAEVSVDIRGDLVRAQVTAHEMHEAIDLLRDRLRDKLEHRAQHRQAQRRRPAASPAGEWRHGDPRGHRPEYFERPPDERRLVRHKTYVDDVLTPDEAVFDMEQADYEFYLFRELASGTDALVERGADGTYRLTRIEATSADPGPTAVRLTVAEHPVPVLDVDEAVERLVLDGGPYVFFVNGSTGRGNVVYRRYDGHYGLIAPE